jgi:putrescine aminotransferase
MTIAKGLSSGYLPIGASLVSDQVADVINAAGSFNHGYTYSGHPVACAVAIENLRLLEEEQIIESVRNDIGPYLQEQWLQLNNHPLIGEARICGLMGALELTPDKASRAAFPGEAGAAGLICRDISLNNGLIMRHVDDKMVISPPLVISRSEVDMLIDRTARSLDETAIKLKEAGLLS